MTNQKLEYLIGKGLITSYEYCNVSEEGEKNKISEMRNSEYLKIIFPDGEELLIETFCSGCMENTTLSIN